MFSPAGEGTGRVINSSPMSSRPHILRAAADDPADTSEPAVARNRRAGKSSRNRKHIALEAPSQSVLCLIGEIGRGEPFERHAEGHILGDPPTEIEVEGLLLERPV